jgi:hypothetical protein
MKALFAGVTLQQFRNWIEGVFPVTLFDHLDKRLEQPKFLTVCRIGEETDKLIAVRPQQIAEILLRSLDNDDEEGEALKVEILHSQPLGTLDIKRQKINGVRRICLFQNVLQRARGNSDEVATAHRVVWR